MTINAEDRRLMRLLAVILTVVWAVTAVAIATAYRPGGPIDIAVALACFIPVVIADMGIIWPAKKMERRHRLALVWVWIGALLFTLPIVYGVATTLADDGPQSLVPSAEAAYAGGIALFLTSFYSVVGIVHRRRGVRPLERRASAFAVLAAVGLTIVAGGRRQRPAGLPARRAPGLAQRHDRRPTGTDPHVARGAARSLRPAG